MSNEGRWETKRTKKGIGDRRHEEKRMEVGDRKRNEGKWETGRETKGSGRLNEQQR